MMAAASTCWGPDFPLALCWTPNKWLAQQPQRKLLGAFAQQKLPGASTLSQQQRQQQQICQDHQTYQHDADVLAHVKTSIADLKGLPSPLEPPLVLPLVLLPLTTPQMQHG